MPLSAAAKLIPGYSDVPIPTLVPHRTVLPASAFRDSTSRTTIVCNYQDGNADLAAIWLHLGIVRPGIPLSDVQTYDPAGTLGQTTVAGRPAVYEIDTRFIGHVSLEVEVEGTTLNVEPYYRGVRSPAAGEEGSGPAELGVAKAIAEAVITGRYANKPPPAASPPAGRRTVGPYGLGATLRDWVAHHDPNSFSAGSDPGDYDGFSGSRVSGANPWWTVVRVRGGRVNYFWMNFRKGTSEAAAIALVKAQLPSDSILEAPAPGDGCKWFEGRSATLARLLGDPPTNDTDGSMTVMLRLLGPSGVGFAIVTANRANPDDPCNTVEPTP